MAIFLVLLFPEAKEFSSTIPVTSLILSYRGIWIDEEDKRIAHELPAEACVHQRSAESHQVGARAGRLDNGERCCEDSVEPTHFSMKNIEDKGKTRNL